MKTAGVICEYNPFHQGHQYHLEQAGKQSGAETVLCVMSGNYVQRAEPALINKWERAAAAVRGGADVVLELPTLWACASAERFALGAVSLLKKAGADCLSYGVETVNENASASIAAILSREPQEYRDVLHEALDQGISYPAAREKALQFYLEQRSMTIESLHEQMTAPNSLLEIEYRKAAEVVDYHPHFVPVLRKGGGHRETDPHESDYRSASAIRKEIRGLKHPTLGGESESGNAFPEGLRQAFPGSEASHMEALLAAGSYQRDMAFWETILYYRLMTMTREEIRETEGIGEGLENALLHRASERCSWDRLVSELTSARYPASRIRHCLMNICLGITRKQTAHFQDEIPYLKVLAFSEKGQELMHQWTEEGIELLTNPGKQYDSLSKEGRVLLDLEARWTDLYMLGQADPQHYRRGMEYRRNAVRIAKTEK